VLINRHNCIYKFSLCPCTISSCFEFTMLNEIYSINVRVTPTPPLQPLINPGMQGCPLYFTPASFCITNLHYWFHLSLLHNSPIKFYKMDYKELMPLAIDRSYIDFEEITELSTDRPFIQANTEVFSLQDIRTKHTIPAFAKCNEPLISHTDFIDLTYDITADIFQREAILSPNIRLSHPIKGRVPEAKEKAAKDLLGHEKTIYYERMAFIIEIPTISDVVGGNKLSLTVGGVKAYNQANLYSKKGAEEHFKCFIGFQNKVCTNLCIWTEGIKADIKIRSIEELRNAIYCLIQEYNASSHLSKMQDLTNYHLTERQFAQLIGRCKMYNYLPTKVKADIPTLLFGDSQISTICKDYYRDKSFCRNDDGSIGLWKVYNLFTEANKSSYIDSFLDRSVNAFQFTEGVKEAVKYNQANWFLQ